MLGLVRIVAGLSLMLGVASPAWAAAPAPLGVPAPLAQTQDAGLEPFVDGLMASHLDHYKIPGAVIAVVKDGKVLFAKGYGYADVDQKTPVDPRTSMFRIASTTKLFTWTAVMQLVEQGKLDLDRDVNTYLKAFKIPATYPQPITLRQLMTHTSGFDRGGVGYEITTDLDGHTSIAGTLEKHMPKRVRPPGSMSSYSNYGAALAGLIVEEVSGMPYDDYIQRNIFDRLGMAYATTREPLPAQFGAKRVVGYRQEAGVFVRPSTPTYEGGFRPAGSGTVSALDMARFMIAELPGSDGPTLMRPQTLALMQAPAFYLDKRLPAMALGYYEDRIAGERVVSHGGADPLFNTELYLLPERRMGIFVSYSGGHGDVAAAELAKALLTRFYPKTEVSPEPLRGVALDRYAGSYQFTAISQTRIDKAFGVMSQLNVTADGERLRMGSGEEETQFAPIGPNLFQQVGGDRQIAFRTDRDGKATHLFIDSWPFIPLERTPTIDLSAIWYPVLGGALVLFAANLLGLTYRLRIVLDRSDAERRGVWISAATSLAGLAAMVCLGLAITTTDQVVRLSSVPAFWRISLLLPIALMGLTLAALAVVWKAWARSYWSVSIRLFHTLASVFAAALCLFFLHWNLVGWNFG